MPYLVRGRYVLVRAELDGASTLLHDGAVVVDNGSVIVNGSYADLRASYPDAEVIGDGTQFVLPGLINAHQHGGGVSNTQLGHPDDHLETWLLGGRRAVVDPHRLHAATRRWRIERGEQRRLERQQRRAVEDGQRPECRRQFVGGQLIQGIGEIDGGCGLTAPSLLIHDRDGSQGPVLPGSLFPRWKQN